MLYNDEIPVDNSREPSDTNIFGTNMLLTLGVKVVRKDTAPWFNPFTSLEELIQFRDGMRKPSLSNVPNLKFTNMGIFYKSSLSFSLLLQTYINNTSKV